MVKYIWILPCLFYLGQFVFGINSQIAWENFGEKLATEIENNSMLGERVSQNADGTIFAVSSTGGGFGDYGLVKIYSLDGDEFIEDSEINAALFNFYYPNFSSPSEIYSNIGQTGLSFNSEGNILALTLKASNGLPHYYVAIVEKIENEWQLLFI